jgi:hypothetical protein
MRIGLVGKFAPDCATAQAGSNAAGSTANRAADKAEFFMTFSNRELIVAAAKQFP